MSTYTPDLPMNQKLMKKFGVGREFWYGSIILLSQNSFPHCAEASSFVRLLGQSKHIASPLHPDVSRDQRPWSCDPGRPSPLRDTETAIILPRWISGCAATGGRWSDQKVSKPETVPIIFLWTSSARTVRPGPKSPMSAKCSKGYTPTSSTAPT